MAIFNILHSFVCDLLGHDFGEWKYTLSDSCRQVRTCNSDGYQEQREAHDFDEWKEEISNPCWQVHTCTRDGYREKRQVHRFGKWEYEAPNSCWQIRTCEEDGIQEQRQAPHQFNSWVSQCEERQVYEDGAEGEERLKWEERKCMRCGYTETKNMEKWWR